jgi:hypothetical protein
MSPVEKLKRGAAEVPVEGLTWGKLLAGMGAFLSMLVASGTLFSMIVVPIVVAQSDRNAREITAEMLAQHADIALHSGAVPRPEYDAHVASAAAQYEALRDDIQRVVDILMERKR